MDSLSSCAAHLSIELGMPVAILERARNSKISMRIDPRTGGARLTVPLKSVPARVAKFVRGKASWLYAEKARMPPWTSFNVGQTISLFGVERTIAQAEQCVGQATLREDACGASIVVTDADRAESQVTALIKAEAALWFDRVVREKASKIDRCIATVVINDTMTRWGYCRVGGNLSFNWRLAMAPIEVADYAASHEVAHLLEMNHRLRFWHVCRSLSAKPPEESIAWLKEHGAHLCRYGPV